LILEKVKLKLEKEALEYIRVWIWFTFVVSAVNAVGNLFTNDAEMHLVVKIFHLAMTAVILGCLGYSYLRELSTMKLASICYQFKVYVSLLQKQDVLENPTNVKLIVFFTFLLIVMCVFNTIVLAHLFPKHSSIIYLCNN